MKEKLASFTLHDSYTAYIYKDVSRNLFVGKIIRCEREERNDHNPYAVALKKAGTGKVGHNFMYLHPFPKARWHYCSVCDWTTYILH